MLITLAKLLFFLYLCLQNLLTSYTKFNVITTLLCLSSILFNIGILCWIISMTIMLMITLNFDIISKFYVVGIKSFKTFVQLEKMNTNSQNVDTLTSIERKLDWVSNKYDILCIKHEKCKNGLLNVLMILKQTLIYRDILLMFNFVKHLFNNVAITIYHIFCFIYEILKHIPLIKHFINKINKYYSTCFILYNSKNNSTNNTYDALLDDDVLSDDDVLLDSDIPDISNISDIPNILNMSDMSDMSDIPQINPAQMLDQIDQLNNMLSTLIPANGAFQNGTFPNGAFTSKSQMNDILNNIGNMSNDITHQKISIKKKKSK